MLDYVVAMGKGSLAEITYERKGNIPWLLVLFLLGERASIIALYFFEALVNFSLQVKCDPHTANLSNWLHDRALKFIEIVTEFIRVLDKL